MTLKTSMPVVAAGLALAALSTLADAQAIWRCGADGRSYSTTPCAEGRAIETGAAPSSAEQQSARRVAAADRQLADRLRSERLQNEAATQRTALGGFATSPPGPAVSPQSARPEPRRPPEAAGTWRATAPASRRARG